MDKQLTQHLARAIAEYQSQRMYSVEIMDVLRALEELRFRLTEDLIKARQK